MDDLLAPFRLAADVALIPYERLAAADRRRIDGEPGDTVVSRRGGRARSKVLSAEAAELVALYREPTTLVDAVRRFAAEKRYDPDAVLDQAFPLLRQLVNQGFIVRDADEPAARPAGVLAPGTVVGGCEVVECVQAYDDVAVYRCRYAGGEVALKLAAPGDRSAAAQLGREGDVLRRIGGRPAPAFVDAGTEDDRAWLAVEWLPGEHVTVHVDRRRDDRRAVLDVCVATVEAFAALHDRGVVHGDVHPRNVLVAPDGEVGIVDFGLSRVVGTRSRFGRPPRGGIGFFFEPEYVTARLAGRSAPSATARSDQYGLGAVLYSLLTGRSYLDFSYDRQRMYDQIATAEPRPFAHCGTLGLPLTEQVVRRALAKRPRDRHPSLHDLAAALRAAADGDLRAGTPAASASRSSSASLELFVREVVEGVRTLDPAALPELPVTPRCSVHSGASGIAYALYRIACNEDDASLLALADRWSHAAIAHRHRDDAYASAADGVTPATVGTSSIFHSAVGSHVVQALISQAMGDFVGVRDNVDAFVAEVERAGAVDRADYFLGAAGHLHACTILRGVLADEVSFARLDRLVALGDRLHHELAAELAAHPPVAEATRFRKLGIAHGWAGALYALLAWSAGDGGGGGPVPPDVRRRLDELAALAEPTAAGVRWPVGTPGASRSRPPAIMTGWCNGTAGHLHLWTAVHRWSGDDADAAMADRVAGEVVASSASERTPFLCCGTAGSAYALLARHRATGDGALLDAARGLAERSLAGIRSPSLPFTSLYRGSLGLAVLASDLAHPAVASMPMFGPEHLA